MARVGFLPENPYVYPYLTPREFVTLCARLSGLSGAVLRERVVDAIDRVGIAQAIDRPARSLSKGMLQRAALAAALVHDPELLILDEPMSGLDPVGRKEVRDLIMDEKQRGHTVFFSSHILSDVELLCDRVCILRQGKVVVAGTLRELLAEKKKRRSEVTLSGIGTDSGADVGEKLRGLLLPLSSGMREMGGALVIEVEGEDAVRAVIDCALAEGARLEAITPKRETLEDLFVREAL